MLPSLGNNARVSPTADSGQLVANWRDEFILITLALGIIIWLAH